MKIATEDKVVRDPNIGIDRRVFAGQPIPPDLVDAYEEAGGSVTDEKPSPSGKVIAKKTVDVRDPNIGITRRVIEGQIVPPDLVAAYAEEAGDSDAADAAAKASAEGERGVDYSSKPVEDLQAEVERRGLDVEGSGANGNVVKADLVDALEADDAK